MSFLNLLNKQRTVPLKRLSKQYKKSNLNYKLPIILGENKEGEPEFADLVDLKHIIMGGTTGSGKSMFFHTIISTLISLYTPNQLRIYLADVKRVEYSSYEGLPHLLNPINKSWEVDKVFTVLEWLIHEKNNRLQLDKAEINKYPYIVVVIDTFSDLMAYDQQNFEDYISKLIDGASKVKVHVIISDSRTGIDLYTNLIMSLFPTKICFNVSTVEASELIIGASGGEKLLGIGDMLFLPPNRKEAIRIQAPYISDKEINKFVKVLNKGNNNGYSIMSDTNKRLEDLDERVRKLEERTSIASYSNTDLLLDQAKEIVAPYDEVSASLLQRRLAIGYSRAVRILDLLQQEGIVSDGEGSKPRKVLKK